jgi:hypothetical protein
VSSLPPDSNYTLEVIFHKGNETFCATNNCYWGGVIYYTGVYEGQHGSWGLNTGGYDNSRYPLIIYRCSAVKFTLQITSNSRNPYSTLTVVMLSQSGEILFSQSETGGIDASWTTPS